MQVFISVIYRHRHQSDHECEKLDTPKPRMAATQQLVKDIIGEYNGKYIYTTVFFRRLVTFFNGLDLTKIKKRMGVPCLNSLILTCLHVIVFTLTATRVAYI